MPEPKITQTEEQTQSADTQTMLPERKVVRKETFTLTKNDLFLLQNLANAIEMAHHTADLAQQNVNNLLGIFSIERWGFPENVDVRFSDFNMEKGVITVEELEMIHVPKTEAAAETAATEQSAGSSDTQASGETEDSAEEEIPKV